MSDPQPQKGGWSPGTFLAKLAPGVGDELLHLCRPRIAAAGEHLTRQGERNGQVFLLQASTPGAAAFVKVTSVARNGAESLLAICTAGDLIGEGAALRDGACAATVTTCTETVVHAVERRKFLDFLDFTPTAWQVLSALLADRLDWSNRRRLDFSGYDVRVRLARIMLELVESHGVHTALGVELGVEVSQAELGKIIGAKPDAVSVALRRLKSEGLIASRYRGVRITDVRALRRVADED